MRVQTSAKFLVLAGLSLARQLDAGVFTGTVVCPLSSACAPARPASNAAVVINPYGIVHPITFVPAGGTLANVKICVADTAGSDLELAAQWATAKWNALEPKLHNCAGCKSWEDAEGVGAVNFPSVLLHEMGHCVAGINHIYLGIDADGNGQRENTDYTISYGGAVIGLDEGADLVRGSKDDDQDASGGTIAEVVNWFPIATNDPINPSLFTVDSLTYSRARSDLAGSGSTYSASSNAKVAALLGKKNTQSVMGRNSRNLGRFDLAPDDVSSILLARTGLDRLAGTSDDYQVSWELVSCSDPHDVTIQHGTLAVGTAGQCTVSVDFSSPNPPSPAIANSYKLLTGAVIVMNTAFTGPWEYSIPLFYGSFESGTYDADWSVVE